MVGSSGLFLILIRHGVTGRTFSRRCCSGPDSASCGPCGRSSGPPATSAPGLEAPFCGLFRIVAVGPLDHIADYRGSGAHASPIRSAYVRSVLNHHARRIVDNAGPSTDDTCGPLVVIFQLGICLAGWFLDAREIQYWTKPLRGRHWIDLPTLRRSPRLSRRYSSSAVSPYAALRAPGIPQALRRGASHDISSPTHAGRHAGAAAVAVHPTDVHRDCRAVRWLLRPFPGSFGSGGDPRLPANPVRFTVE